MIEKRELAKCHFELKIISLLFTDLSWLRRAPETYETMPLFTKKKLANCYIARAEKETRSNGMREATLTFALEGTRY